MTTDLHHPDRLGPGDCVGPWKILGVLGAGGLGRVFKVESEGKVYALKMALRPPGEPLPGEQDVDGWCMREATGLLGRAPHPNIPRPFQLDFGSVSLPGARPLTQGLPPMNLSVVPPEALEHTWVSVQPGPATGAAAGRHRHAHTPRATPGQFQAVGLRSRARRSLAHPRVPGLAAPEVLTGDGMHP